MNRIEKTRINKEKVYDLMTGSLVLDNLEESDLIEDEFATGMPCEQLYQEVYEAKCRLCSRLDVDEDSDVELIIDNLLNIGRRLSMKMFEYGSLYGNCEDKN